MKILSIKSLNINSLKGKTEIDFASLTKDSSLFAITGPTGSGKSTILDIISCALYGRTARLKNPNDLMSRHCGEAYCEVEFEIRGKNYRSSWSQKRARKKHDGNFQTAKMELVDLVEDKILPLKSREVPKKIEELSGLDFNRFTQSMLLAQGGFDAFLKADEKERSLLLEKITGTQIYAEISIAIFEKHRTFAQEIESQQRVLESIELLDDETLQTKERQLTQNIIQKRETDKELDELSFMLNWLKQVRELREESKKREEEFLNATKKKEESRDSFDMLHLANRALNVSSKYSLFSQLQKSVTVDKTLSITLEKELSVLDGEIKIKSDNHSALKKELLKESIVFENQTQKLKEARVIQTKEKQTQEQITKESKALENKESSLLKLTKDLRQLSDKYSEIENKIERSKSYILKNSRDEKIVSVIGLIEQSIKDYKQEKKLLAKNLKELAEVKIEVDKSSSIESLKAFEKSIDSIKKHIETLRDKKVKEQLLQKYEEDRACLVESEECFLCGSKEHPFAKVTVDVNIDETESFIVVQIQELQEQESALNRFNIAKEKNTTLYEQLTLSVNARESKVKSLYETLKNSYKELDEELNIEALDTQYDAFVKRGKLYKEALESLKNLELDFNRYKLEKKESETKITSIKDEISVHLGSLKELELTLKELALARVTLLNIADLEAYEREITVHYKSIESKEQLLFNLLNELNVKREERLVHKKSLDLKIVEDSKNLESLNIELEELYAQNGFKNVQELLNATLDKERREELASFCKSIEERFSGAKTLNDEIVKKLQESEKESLTTKSFEELKTLQALLEQKKDVVQESVGSVKKELEIDKENRDKHKDKILSLLNRQNSFKVWVKLNELVGSADGTKFKKFAQGITLDQLINLANQHLKILSSRYTLARNQEKLLELEVVDAYQGNVIRPVTTLSGGESFIVSLALALGLSELASQKIAIDSLFLDEGFGTLDEESLETALNALNLLQSGGKMVGVISHVEALKERIPLQIKVVPNGDGSSFVEVG